MTWKITKVGPNEISAKIPPNENVPNSLEEVVAGFALIAESIKKDAKTVHTTNCICASKCWLEW